MKIDTTKLVDAKGLLIALFPENCRPSVRWLRTQQKKRNIRFYKIGHLVFFNVDEVRECLEKRNLIKAV